MRIELRDVISHFRHDQEQALTYLHARLGIPVPKTNMEWATNARTQIESHSSQWADDGVQLRKHGYGIEVIHPDFQIDFDYGPAGECDCFDAWRLALYKHVSLGISDPVECERQIRDWIAEAQSVGTLIQVPNANTFFVWPESRSPWSVAKGAS